jgi:phage tail-like protein
MPGRREHDSAVGHRLGLEVDGVRVTMLTEVSGLGVEREVIEVRESAADGSTVTRRLPGRPRPGEVALSRVLTADTTFERWARDASLGPPGARPRAAVVLFDQAGSPVRRYTLVNAWPSTLEISGLSLAGAAVPTETLVLVHEGIDLA